jgi:hypothetical protein
MAFVLYQINTIFTRKIAIRIVGACLQEEEEQMTDDEKIMILKETFKGRNDAYGEGAGLCTKKPIRGSNQIDVILYPKPDLLIELIFGQLRIHRKVRHCPIRWD